MATITSTISDRLDSVRDNLSRAQEQLSDFYDNARDRVARGAKTTDRAIRGNPYQAMGIALGVGVALGWLLGRRK